MCILLQVHSTLGYGSVIWAGAADTHAVRIDRVQHNFLMCIPFNMASGHVASLAYNKLVHYFRQPALSTRGVRRDLVFMLNLFNARQYFYLLAGFRLLTCTSSIGSLFYGPHPRVNMAKRGCPTKQPTFTKCT